MATRWRPQHYRPLISHSRPWFRLRWTACSMQCTLPYVGVISHVVMYHWVTNASYVFIIIANSHKHTQQTSRSLIFCSQSLELTICQHPRISVTSYFQMSSRHFTFSQPTPIQLSTLPRISLFTRPDSSKTLALYKSCTYLLTYLWQDTLGMTSSINSDDKLTLCNAAQVFRSTT